MIKNYGREASAEAVKHFRDRAMSVKIAKWEGESHITQNISIHKATDFLDALVTASSLISNTIGIVRKILATAAIKKKTKISSMHLDMMILDMVLHAYVDDWEKLSNKKLSEDDDLEKTLFKVFQFWMTKDMIDEQTFKTLLKEAEVPVDIFDITEDDYLHKETERRGLKVSDEIIDNVFWRVRHAFSYFKDM